MITDGTPWFALVLSLPTPNATARMRIWRALKALGCGALRDGVYLLPEHAAAQTALGDLARSITQSGGSAQVLRVGGTSAEHDADLRRLFDRSEQYAVLLDAMRAAKSDPRGSVRTLRTAKREFEAIVAIDFFPGEAQAQARRAIRDLEAVLAPGEPGSSDGQVRRLDVSEYQGRVWATRRHLWVDRMASAWLIGRFIDRSARFVWLDRPQDCPDQALGFDFDGAAFTHTDAKVTFEVLAASFGLEDDPALAQIGRIVHYLDVGGIAVAEAAGVEAMLDGMRATLPDDDRLLEAALQAFDFLYRSTHDAKDTA